MRKGLPSPQLYGFETQESYDAAPAAKHPGETAEVEETRKEVSVFIAVPAIEGLWMSFGVEERLETSEGSCTKYQKCRRLLLVMQPNC